uniref:18 kDa Sin3-associated polypeptide n=1 Tax=Heterorhabditis bacteriophora TaxID=37862 RepID=A0A1I7XTC4_HETBA
MTTVISQVAVNQEKPVDREKICPLLLRVFCANGRHNPIADYTRGNVPANELQMYTWLAKCYEFVHKYT